VTIKFQPNGGVAHIAMPRCMGLMSRLHM